MVKSNLKAENELKKTSYQNWTEIFYMVFLIYYFFNAAVEEHAVNGGVQIICGNVIYLLG